MFYPQKQIKKGENICLHKETLFGRCVDYDSGDGSHDDDGDVDHSDGGHVETSENLIFFW